MKSAQHTSQNRSAVLSVRSSGLRFAEALCTTNLWSQP